MPRIKLIALIIIGFIVLSLIGLCLIGYYAEISKEQIFSAVGQITAINQNSIQVQTADNALLVQVDENTEYLKIIMPLFIHEEESTDLAELVKQEQGMFSDLKIGDSIVVNSADNIINKTQIKAKTITKNYVD